MSDFISFMAELISSLGYVGIFLATSFEYACFPLSSEILLPFIGYSVYIGELSLFRTIVFSTAGGGVGSSFCYFLGRFGRGILEKFLKGDGAVRAGIDRAERYFNEKGVLSVFWGRLMPIVRTYISFPAGMTNMKYSKFIAFSTAGAFIWNTVLITCGFLLGEHWNEVSAFFSENKYFIIFAVVAVASVFMYFIKSNKNREKI